MSLDDFLGSTDTAKRLRMIRDPALALELRGYLGDDAFRELGTLAAQADVGGHLSRRHQPNIVFVPGVMGSLLASRTKGGVWWIDARTARHIDDLALSPDGLTDRDPDNEVGPFSTDPVYEPFLTAVLAREDFGHTSFPYDWRRSLRQSADAFRDVVRHCHGKNRGPVHVVAHSMGGVTARVGLMMHGAELWPMIDRVVFIGTPHYGSPAIAGYLKNHLWGFEILALLGTLLSRQSFRSFRGVLGLLPAPFGIYPGTRPDDRVPMHDTLVAGHPCANFDMYRAQAWELGLEKGETRQLQGVLDDAAALHRDLLDAHTRLTSAQRKRILVIAGVGYKTLFRLEYPTGALRSWKRMIKVVDRAAGDANREGDGRVPLASAKLEGVPIRYVRGVHASLPNIPAVYEDVFRWLKGDSLELPKTPAEALAKHLGVGSASVAPSLDGTSRTSVHSDDPGYLGFDEPTDEMLAHSRLQLETGALPAFNCSARIF